jgi:hypothetical protein
LRKRPGLRAALGRHAFFACSRFIILGYRPIDTLKQAGIDVLKRLGSSEGLKIGWKLQIYRFEGLFLNTDWAAA